VRAPTSSPLTAADLARVAQEIKADARALGFTAVGVADIELGEDESHFRAWLAAGFHGELEYMSRHGMARARPAELVPRTVRVVSVRLDYWPREAADARRLLASPEHAYIARYALGRDYHRLMRLKLESLARKTMSRIGPFGYRAFVDSAPVLERPLARNAGLGWIGKHTNLINAEGGSWFFLGELYTDLPLPADPPASAHCGTCSACIPACPTGAIVAPYRLDARRCISYLTIELKGTIPTELRPLIGNRVFGCDDCQLACPWNKFARPSTEPAFAVREGLDAPRLIDLFRMSAQEFAGRFAGSPIRRLGHVRWLRNLAVALGNAPPSETVRSVLRGRRDHDSPIVREHVAWALDRQQRAAQ
jgi:epoxyqueuosine reductase